MIELSKDKIIERFRSYVALDTASDDKSETSPSTAKQLKLAKLLKSELSGLGLDDVALTEYGYVLAALPANTNESEASILGNDVTGSKCPSSINF